MGLRLRQALRPGPTWDYATQTRTIKDSGRIFARFRKDADASLLALVPGRQFLFQEEAVAGHGEAGEEEEDRDEDVDLGRQPLPLGVRQDRLAEPDGVEQADDDHERGVLVEGDETGWTIPGIEIFRAWGRMISAIIFQ